MVGGSGVQTQALVRNAPFDTFADRLLVTTGTDRSVSINMRLGAIRNGTTSYYPQIINVRLLNP